MLFLDWKMFTRVDSYRKFEVKYKRNYGTLSHYRVTTAASDTTDKKAFFSNYGTCVDIIAPVSCQEGSNSYYNSKTCDQ